MKNKIGYIIFGIIAFAIAGLLIYIIVSKHNISSEEFNIKKGDTLTFENYNAEVKILNIASTLCKKEKCKLKGEVEVSLEVTDNGNKSSYTLKSSTDNKKRIKNSNNYVILEYKDDKINIEIKDKNEL